jgi:pyruvate formate lyase activating enzyme
MLSDDAASENVRPARFWQKLNGDVQCSLCHQNCRIRPGKRGLCGVRENQKGNLMTLVYGNLLASNVDPIEKKPMFHFLPGSLAYSIATAGCNFRCLHCQNADISQARPGELMEVDLPPEKIVELARQYGCRGVSYTYTEPTIFFEYCYDTGKLARGAGLSNSFVTNGYMTPDAVHAAKEFLDAARVDLKGDGEHYRKVCGGIVLENVLECIRNIYKAGFHTEVITLVIPGDNDSRDFVKGMAAFLKGLSPEIPWHFTRFYPCYLMTDRPATPVETLEQMHDWAVDEGMKYVYAGNVPGHRYENTYCPRCGALLIGRDSFAVTRVALRKDKKCPDCGQKIPITGEVTPPR